MYLNKKVVVVMPAYNAALTIAKTYEEVIAQAVVDEVIIVDDCSSDNTVEIAQRLDKTIVHAHSRNQGYGGNQKSCYRIALDRGADIVIMVHPDYQYTPLLIPAMVSMIGNNLYSVVLASRILGGKAISGGMPCYKYIANRLLTAFQNICMGAKLSEYHTGYRAFSRDVLLSLDLAKNSDDFIFDNQMLTQILWKKFSIGEVSCPTKYFPEASSINIPRSIEYGIGCIKNSVLFFLAKYRLTSPARFE